MDEISEELHDQALWAASIYRRNFDNRPLEAVAAALGCSRATASRRCDVARRLGYLPATSQGRKRL